MIHNITLETTRLLLRPLTHSDAESIFAWVSDERVTRYMCYNTYTDIGQVHEWLDFLAEESSWHFGFERKSDGLLIGSGDIGEDSSGNGIWGFGYNLRCDCWGSGYATEAVKAMIQFAHERFGAVRFCSSHAEPNAASGRVMEKCGLAFAEYGEFSKLDGSCKMRSKVYRGELFGEK